MRILAKFLGSKKQDPLEGPKGVRCDGRTYNTEITYYNKNRYKIMICVHQMTIPGLISRTLLTTPCSQASEVEGEVPLPSFFPGT